MFCSRQFEPDGWEVRLLNLRKRDVFLILFVLILEVKLLGEESRQNFDLSLGQSLSKADAASAMEGNVAVDMALLTRRSQTQRVAMIEPLWQELVWSLPLGRVVMNRFEVDHNHVTLLEVVLT